MVRAHFLIFEVFSLHCKNVCELPKVTRPPLPCIGPTAPMPICCSARPSSARCSETVVLADSQKLSARRYSLCPTPPTHHLHTLQYTVCDRSRISLIPLAILVRWMRIAAQSITFDVSYQPISVTAPLELGVLNSSCCQRLVHSPPYNTPYWAV